MSTSVLQGVQILLDLTTAIAELSLRMDQVGSVIQRAKDAGRPDFTDDEWIEIEDLDNQARTRLEEAIKSKEIIEPPISGA
jgi:hypothetical protein